MCFVLAMQMRESNVRGGRPQCPVDGAHRVHVHGHYKRYQGPEGDEKRPVPRWLCTVCGGTISVLPDDVLPYRAIGVWMLQAWLDAALCGRDPPAVREKERGCLQRALLRFTERIPSLCSVLGQMVEQSHPSACQLWSELRRLGSNLEDILRLLSEQFKISLLGDYRCLHPWTG